MNGFQCFRWCAMNALLVFVAHSGPGAGVYAQSDEAATGEGQEILTRGPVHEAFAQTVIFNPEPGIVVPGAPADAIEELPPDQRPDGDNVAWIPGYWAWDDDRSDFLWVSGIWRALPPGRQWVPGYWSPTGTEFQWTSGYWADSRLSELEYLPAPPASVEEGPNVAAPSADHLWAPGCWVWNQGRYAWRPGYWVPAQQDWVWIPATYQWSPRGCVFVDGYYDYPVTSRGILFAPVYFSPSVYARRGFRHSPVTAINLAVFGSQLFLRPQYNHYYFGDYYDSRYDTAGFHPWFSVNSDGYAYDPFYARQRWQNRQDAAWEQTVQTEFQRRVDHEDARPPRTLAGQQERLRRGSDSAENSLVAATSVEELAKGSASTLRLRTVTSDERPQLAKHVQEVRQFSAARRKLEIESGEAPAANPASVPEPVKRKSLKSPIVARSPDQLEKEHTVPQAPDFPPTDPKVEQKTGKQADAGKESSRRRRNPAGARPEPVLPGVKSAVTTREPKPDPKPRSQAKPDLKAPKDAPNPVQERKPAPKPGSKAVPKSELKPESKAVPVPESKPAPGRNARSVSKARPESKAPKVEQKTENEDKPVKKRNK